jgi:hypothetical protein
MLSAFPRQTAAPNPANSMSIALLAKMVTAAANTA